MLIRDERHLLKYMSTTRAFEARGYTVSGHEKGRNGRSENMTTETMKTTRGVYIHMSAPVRTHQIRRTKSLMAVTSR